MSTKLATWPRNTKIDTRAGTLIFSVTSAYTYVHKLGHSTYTRYRTTFLDEVIPRPGIRKSAKGSTALMSRLRLPYCLLHCTCMTERERSTLCENVICMYVDFIHTSTPSVELAEKWCAKCNRDTQCGAPCST